MTSPLPSALKRFDLVSIATIITILCISVFTIQSTISAQSSQSSILQQNLINIQLLSIFVGFLLYFVISSINYYYLQYFAIPLYVISIFFLILVLFIGGSTRGSSRWIDLGPFNFQPSSLGMIASVLLMATFLKTIKTKINHIVYFLVNLGMFVIPAILIFIEPDLGSAMVLMIIWFVSLHITPIKFRFLLILYFIGVTSIPVIWTQLHDYQKERIYTFINPAHDPSGSGYNVIQSIIAVGSGGVKGRGWGEGTQSHLQYLPEQHTDFIFATFAEEQGFIGVIILVLLYTIIIARMIQILWKSTDFYTQLIVLGISTWFLSHIVINIGMNIGLLPITGIPLPLMSYGGSAIVTTLVSLGIIQSIYRHNYQ